MIDIYIASPYTHPDPKICEKRFRAVTRLAGVLSNKGYVVFSPITHSHPIAKETSLPTNWEFWKKIDKVFIKLSKVILVFTIDGWKESKGVQEEIKIGKKLGKKICFLKADIDDFLKKT